MRLSATFMPGVALATLLAVIGCVYTTDWTRTIESIRMERLSSDESRVHVPNTRSGMEAAIRKALDSKDLQASMSIGRLQPVHQARKSMLIPEDDVAVDVRPWPTGSPPAHVVSSATDVSPASNSNATREALHAYETEYKKFLARSRVEPVWHSLTDNQKMKKGAEATWKQRDAVQRLRYRIERDGRHVDAAVRRIKDDAKRYGLDDNSVLKRMLRRANLPLEPLD